MSFDIREKVFYDASLQQNLSIMDRNLNERIAAAFALHPWVAKVNGVRKSYSAGVVVDLEYRRPVCMVHTCGKFIPVDVEGYALPAWDIPRSEIGRYPPSGMSRSVNATRAFGGQVGRPEGAGSSANRGRTWGSLEEVPTTAH